MTLSYERTRKSASPGTSVPDEADARGRQEGNTPLSNVITALQVGDDPSLILTHYRCRQPRPPMTTTSRKVATVSHACYRDRGSFRTIIVRLDVSIAKGAFGFTVGLSDKRSKEGATGIKQRNPEVVIAFSSRRSPHGTPHLSGTR